MPPIGSPSWFSRAASADFTVINVLYITFEFPPVNTTGAFRPAKFAKYLRGYGINPVILSLDPEQGADAFSASVEPSLLEELPSDLRVYRLECPSAAYQYRSRARAALTIWTRVYDSFAARVRRSLDAVLPELVRRERPELVLVSAPPFSAGPLAAEIAARLRLPLVVDMRDGWSQWCAGPFPSYLHYRAVLAAERRLFSQASAVVTVTEELANVFRRTHPRLPSSRFHVVPNGYDGDVALPEVYAPRDSAPGADRVIGYVGNFYYSPAGRAAALEPWWARDGHRKLHYSPVREDWLYRSPEFFLRAWRSLMDEDSASAKRLRFELVGAVPDWFPSMVARHGLADRVVTHGRVSHAKARELQQGFDALLCTSVKVLEGEDYALASKTFEYVVAGRPVLGFVTRGAQRRFLEKSGIALVCDPDEVSSGVDALRQIATEDVRLRPNRVFLADHHRRHQSGEIARILQAVRR